MTGETVAPPTVFISYSHDSPNHKAWVLSLSERLVTMGIDVMLDAWDIVSGDDVAKYMERSVRSADYVLLICTEIYAEKADQAVGGAGYEAMIVTGELMRQLGTAKFIPIIRQTPPNNMTPANLATRLYVDLSEDRHFDKAFEGLVRDLHKTPAALKPQLGVNPFSSPSTMNSSALLLTSRRDPLFEEPDRFLRGEKPLGVLDDFASSSGPEVTLCQGSPIWLYLQPGRRPVRPFASDAIKQKSEASGVILQPLQWADLHYVRAVDGFGTFHPSSRNGGVADSASSVAFAFDDGSLLYIDTGLIDSANGVIPCEFIEAAMEKAFNNGLAFNV